MQARTILTQAKPANPATKTNPKAAKTATRAGITAKMTTNPT